MSRVQQKRLRVDAVVGVDSWEWFSRVAEPNVAAWLDEIDAGNVSPDTVTTEPAWDLPAIDNSFDFAVVQMDAAGNRSDPTSFPAWENVSLDTTPPNPATGGVIESVAG